MNREEVIKVLEDASKKDIYPDFTGEDLSDLDLSGLDLRGAIFDDADLTDANLSHCDMRFASLCRAKLTNAIFIDTDLREAFLDFIDFSKVDLRNACLYGASGDFLFFEGGDMYACLATRHRVYIGCKSGTLEWWLSNGYAVSVQEGISERDRTIYLSFLYLVKEWMKGYENGS